MARPFGTFKYDNKEDLVKGISEYFQHCDDNNKPYTLADLATWLNIHRETLLNYAKNENYFDVIAHARQMVYGYNERASYDKNKHNGAKLWLLNFTNGDYRDRQEYSVTLSEAPEDPGAIREQLLRALSELPESQRKEFLKE